MHRVKARLHKALLLLLLITWVEMLQRSYHKEMLAPYASRGTGRSAHNEGRTVSMVSGQCGAI